MKNKKLIILMWVLALLPFLLVAVFWGRLPEQIPMHWNIAGEVDGYASKGALWPLCCISPALALMLQFLPRLDPKKENYRRFQKIYDLVGILVSCLMLFPIGITVLSALNPGALNVGRLTMGVISVIFILLGAVMGKIKSNWFMGIRTPWALSDPDVWNKTNRMGGWVFFLAGVVTLLLSLFAPEWAAAAAMLTILLVGTVSTYVMSWKWYQDKIEQNKED